ncbi:MAG: phosphotransferase [Propionibacteriaceae bacterium]|jgi:maltokinase|nr:phosphotransferase [Propionibacteriaceae bacterium]
MDARWFQAKGTDAEIERVEPLDWYWQSPECSVRSELAYVRAQGALECYHLLLGYAAGAGGTALRAEMPEQVRHDGWGVAEVPEQVRHDGWGVAEVPEQVRHDGWGVAEVPGQVRGGIDVPSSPVTMRAFLRGVIPLVDWLGEPPDPELPSRLFTVEQSHTNVAVGDVLCKVLRKLAPGPGLEAEMLAALAGSGITPELRGVLRGGGYELVLFVDLVSRAEDGWEHALTAPALEDDMRSLGGTLRQLHTLLADRFGAAPGDPAQVAAAMRQRLAQAIAEFPELGEYALAVSAAFDRLADLPFLTVQRLHGDFHLGQTLRTPTGYKIIDFEGEPLKTPAQRREPDSVWRDVAGLTRSLDYARAAGRHTEHWRDSARTAFLEGYGADAGAELAAYEADKAVYEYRYEARNRPSWLAIPAGGLRRLSI